MIGSVIIGVVLLVFVNKKSYWNPYILVLSCTDSTAERKAKEFLAGQVQKCVVKSKSVQKGKIELNLEIRMKEDHTDFVNILSEMHGIDSAVLVSYNGEYMG